VPDAVEESRVEYLPPPEPGEDEPKPATQKRSGGAIGAAGAALLAFILKFKLLLFVGLKLLAPMWSFLLSLWIYIAIFGWKLAVVVMLVLLAHELGHYFAFRAYGLPVRLPAFVPLFGAFTAGAPPDDLEHDAYIALAGPLTGLGLAAVCYGLGLQHGDRFWFACADVSAFLNLFNMIPMPPFDGGRIAGALWTPLWIAGIVLFVAMAFWLHVPLFFVIIVAVLSIPALMRAWRGEPDPRAARMTFGARVRVSLWYVATLAGLYAILAESHAAASSAVAGRAF
jgi:Zn-dependent protease